MRERVSRGSRRFWAAFLVLTTALVPPLAPAAIPAAAHAANKAVPAVANLSLRWEVVDNFVSKASPKGRSRAVFTLTNTGPRPLPASGWTLYFNSLSGAEPAAGDDRQIVEHVNGSLFRIRPAPSPALIQPGQSLRLYLEHPEVMVKTEKAPVGPYIVFDSTPSAAQAIRNYQSVPLPRSRQLAGAPEGVGDLVSPEEIFRRNAAIADLPEAGLPPVLPTPQSVARAAGAVRLSARSQVVAPPALSLEAGFAGTLLGPYKGSAAHAAPVRLAIAPIPGQTSPEAYRLVIDPRSGVSVTGASAAGVYYGLQSLRQLVHPSAGGAAEVPAMTITDAPRFAYRGLLLDVARNFQSKETVFGVLDLMARYKLNRLHLHLTDDEGWRLEIKALPELTRIGARRGYSLANDMLPPAYGSGPDPADPHGSGFYSQADYIEILKYARARHIEVIPEIEMPGHARAAVKAMQARYRALKRKGAPHPDRFLLSDPADRSVYSSPQLYNDNAVNPGMPSVYTFIDTVVGELAQLHKAAGMPLRTLHVGADELAAGVWERSPAAEREMKRIGAGSTADLWDHFYDRVEAIARRHGASIAGWEELGVRKVKTEGAELRAPNPHFLGRGLAVYVWNNLGGSEDLAYRLADAGYSVVLAPATNLYFDQAYNRDAAEPGHNWAAYADLEDVYGFDPFDMAGAGASLTDSGRARIQGLEGTLFSETMRTPERLDYMMAPRLFALAERAWAVTPAWTVEPDKKKAVELRAQDWSRFVNVLGKRVLPRLDEEAPALTYRIPPPGLMLQDGKVVANYELPGFVLRYATGGAVPDRNSPVVSGPIGDRTTVTVAAFSRNGREGRTSSIDNR